VLYRAEAFEPLTDAAWDGVRARRAIRELVADVDGSFDAETLWPADDWDAWQTPLPLKSLYVGAAGVLWALDALRRRGLAETGLDLAAAARRTVELWRAEPDFMAGVELPEQRAAALLGGESGILVVAWRLTSDRGLADDLLARVRENVDSEADELMWGTAGTMLAADAMLVWTGEPRWAEAWQTSADRLLGRREADGLWTQQLWGTRFRGLSASHGAAGNVAALLRRRELLGAEGSAELEHSMRQVLERTAVVEDGLANWPLNDGEGLVGADGQIRLQWDYGGPGMVVSAGSCLDEQLLLAGAELAWRAGPHGPEKGPCICHGTAGNGYALLKAFERTGDERWLERARRFAVHALEQVERTRRERGHGRYSLWTGDLGVALFAADCLEARTGYPVLHGWE
jgi:lantibiotic modifying enzyme